jgi:hypothetical protein
VRQSTSSKNKFNTNQNKEGPKGLFFYLMNKLLEIGEDISASIGSIFMIHILNVETIDLMAKIVAIGCQMAIAGATIYGILAKIKDNNKKEE